MENKQFQLLLTLIGALSHLYHPTNEEERKHAGLIAIEAKYKMLKAGFTVDQIMEIEREML